MRATELAAWIAERVREAGARGVVIGLTGGMDSVVVAGLCRLALPGRVHAAVLPCSGEPWAESAARQAASHFGIPIIQVDLAPAAERLVADLDSGLRSLPPAARTGDGADRQAAIDDRASWARAELTRRLRMASLYFLAQSLDALVAGALTRSALTVGRFTKYGDSGADLQPLGSLLTSDVLLMARDLDVPASLIEEAPADDRLPPPLDGAAAAFSDADLERYLTRGPDAVSPALALRIERRMRRADDHYVTPPVPDPHDRG